MTEIFRDGASGRVVKPAAVLDTNVVLDLFSCHSVLDEPNRRNFRHGRALAALRVAMCCHELRQDTFSIAGEVIRVLKQKRPTRKEDPRNAFVVFFTQVVKERVLDGWHDATVEGLDQALVGNACDSLLVRKAAEQGIPIITTERLREDGTINHDTRLRKEAARLSVQLLTPYQFCRHSTGFDPIQAALSFLKCLNAASETFVVAHPHPAPARALTDWIVSYYEWVIDESPSNAHAPSPPA